MPKILFKIFFARVICGCNLCFLVIFLVQTLSAQNLIERHRKIRQAVDQRDYKTARRELKQFLTDDQKTFELNNYDYLLARISEKIGDAPGAAANYQTVVKRNSVLRDYAVWHLSQLQRASGNLWLERLFLKQLTLTAPDSLLSQPATMRIAESFYESGDYAGTVQSLKSKVQSSAGNLKFGNQKLVGANREKLALLGNALLRDNQKPAAREVFSQLIANLPNPATPDDFALAAVRGLDQLDADAIGDANKKIGTLADFEHMRRAFIYQFNRDFTGARAHLQAVVNNYPSSPNRPDALMQLGRVAVLEEKYQEAAAVYRRVQAEYPTHPAARDALNAVAGAYSRAGNFDEAISNYQIYIGKYIENVQSENDLPDNPERPFLNLIDALRDRGRDAEALDWVRTTRERFKNQLPEAQAVFSEARIRLSQNDFNAALRSLNELENMPDLGGTRVAGGTNQAEIRFLLGFCLEQLARYEEAFNVYIAIPDGRAEYYGWRATARLQNWSRTERSRQVLQARFNLFRAAAIQAFGAKDFERARQNAQNALRLTVDENQKRELLEILRQTYQILPAYRNPPRAELIELGRQKVLEKPTASNNSQTVADELLFLGLYDEAAPELGEQVQSPKFKVQSPTEELIPKSKIENPKTNTVDWRKFALATVYKRADLADRATAFAEPLWRAVPPDFALELAARESLELLFPAPFTESLRAHAVSRQLDPRFLLAIMRQESRFQASAKSAAAARGLMQFIPETANRIAAGLNQPNFEQNDLYDSDTAILIGSEYISDLFQQFPVKPEAVAASYNGGENNMTRWLVRSRATEADRFVPEIQFSQSKDYVYKVMANYRVYQFLYDENLQPK